MENNSSALRVVEGGFEALTETEPTPETPTDAAARMLRDRFAHGADVGDSRVQAQAWTVRAKAAEAYGRSEGARKARRAIRASVRDELTALGLLTAPRSRK
jgi:hypothetical protein